MNKPLHICGSLLARNTILNFIGQAMPLLVGVVTILFIVRGLGKERLGLHWLLSCRGAFGAGLGSRGHQLFLRYRRYLLELVSYARAGKAY